jgi:hypothetical protein
MAQQGADRNAERRSPTTDSPSCRAAFMAAVLLRVARLDAFDLDASLNHQT